MSQAKTTAHSAADWVARLSGEPVEADWLAFEAWLSAAAGHRIAYDRALALSLAIDSQATDLIDRVAVVGRRPAPARRSYWGAGLTAAAAVAVTFAVLTPRPEPKAEVYVTAKGERRDIVLSDGTRVALNAGSRLEVAMRPDRRQLTLAAGEAAFKVVHDPSRPFLVHVGDRDLRDVGTEFDVTRQGGVIRVVVREGMVAVTRPGNDRSLSLGPGSSLEHKEGSSDTLVMAADPDEAFSWKSGRLIYRDRPLSEVAADLSRYGRAEVETSGAAASLKFTGVLTIGDQPSMVRRLTDLLPVVASPPRKDGVILLSELNSSK